MPRGKTRTKLRKKHKNSSKNDDGSRAKSNRHHRGGAPGMPTTVIKIESNSKHLFSALGKVDQSNVPCGEQLTLNDMLSLQQNWTHMLCVFLNVHQHALNLVHAWATKNGKDMRPVETEDKSVSEVVLCQFFHLVQHLVNHARLAATEPSLEEDCTVFAMMSHCRRIQGTTVDVGGQKLVPQLMQYAGMDAKSQAACNELLFTVAPRVCEQIKIVSALLFRTDSSMYCRQVVCRVKGYLRLHEDCDPDTNVCVRRDREDCDMSVLVGNGCFKHVRNVVIRNAFLYSKTSSFALRTIPIAYGCHLTAVAPRVQTAPWVACLVNGLDRPDPFAYLGEVPLWTAMSEGDPGNQDEEDVLATVRAVATRLHLKHEPHRSTKQAKHVTMVVVDPDRCDAAVRERNGQGGRWSLLRRFPCKPGDEHKHRAPAVASFRTLCPFRAGRTGRGKEVVVGTLPYDMLHRLPNSVCLFRMLAEELYTLHVPQMFTCLDHEASGRTHLLTAMPVVVLVPFSVEHDDDDDDDEKTRVVIAASYSVEPLDPCAHDLETLARYSQQALTREDHRQKLILTVVEEDKMFDRLDPQYTHLATRFMNRHKCAAGNDDKLSERVAEIAKRAFRDPSVVSDLHCQAVRQARRRQTAGRCLDLAREATKKGFRLDSVEPSAC